MTKTQKLILIFLAAVVVILSAVFIFVFNKVDAVKYNITATFEPYEYRDGILISKDKNTHKAMRFVTNMGTYRELEIGIFDLTDYSGAQELELETVIACRDSNNLIPISGNAMPYYNLDNCFIYGTKGQEKYLVDTDSRTVTPLLDRSSVNVEGVCTNGEFLLENDGKTITVLQRKDRTTNEIISENKIEIIDEYDSIDFVSWYNERFALIRLNSGISTRYAVVDGNGGTCTVIAATNDVPAFLSEPLSQSEDDPTDGLLDCYNELISNKFLQCYKNVHDIMTDSYTQTPSGEFIDIFSGIRYNSGLDTENFIGHNTLLGVSDDGTYAVYKTALKSDPNRNIEYVIFEVGSGKYHTLSEILGNEVFIDDVYFVYNNVIFVNFAELGTGKESSCSIKLSF